MKFPSILSVLVILALAVPLGVANAAEVEFQKGDVIAVIGNTLAERMHHYGYFETFLHARYPDHQLTIRNLGWSADEIDLKPREDKVPTEDDWLQSLKPDAILAFFGSNESHQGIAALPDFESRLEKYIDHLLGSNLNGKGTTRLILVSPIAYERISDHLPESGPRNAELAAYSEAMERVAQRKGVGFIDLFGPTQTLMTDSLKTGKHLTINGVHLNRLGDWHASRVLAEAFGFVQPEVAGDPEAQREAEELRELVNEKNRQFFYRYRPLNSCYIWGQRREPFGIHNFPEELKQWDEIVAGLDREIWSRRANPAALWQVEPDYIEEGYDPYTPAPILPAHKVEVPSIEEMLKSFKVARDYEVNLYASEENFPISSPMAMAFDEKGRLWISNSPTYPHLMPGMEPNDSIIILEDSDLDGKADKHTVFASGLYIPTGFAIGDGGAYIAQQPDLLHFKDADGDGVADLKKTVLHGFGNADSHHSISAFCWEPGGGFYMHEGVFLYTSVETPWGPFRARDASVLRYFPEAHRFDVLSHCGYANPWGHVVDRWGQSILNDASGGRNHFFAHHMANGIYPNKNTYGPHFLFPGRPAAGVELISSRHFPEDVQGSFVVNNSIGFHGTFWRGLAEYKSGLRAYELGEEMLQSDLESFRPVGVSIGPDGALYILDFCNPIIGHMQYSLRDERRDHAHGRVWRIAHKSRPISPQPKISGEPIPVLLDLLNHDEIRVQKFVRRELQERNPVEVLPQLENWIASLDPADPNYEHSLTEALWIYQGFDVPNLELLDRVLSAEDYHARAAGGRVLRYWITMGHVEDPLPRLERLVNDPAIRVRLEGILACGFVKSSEAANIALQAAEHELDEWMIHVLKDTLRALRPNGEPTSTVGRAKLASVMSDQDLMNSPRDRWFAAEIVNRTGIDESKRNEMLDWYAGEFSLTPTGALLQMLSELDSEGRDGGGLQQRLLAQNSEALQEEAADLERLLKESKSGAVRQTVAAALLKSGGPGKAAAWSARLDPRDFLAAVPLLDSGDPALSAVADAVLSHLPDSAAGEGDAGQFTLHRLAMKAAVSIASARPAAFERLAQIAEESTSEKHRSAALAAMNSISFSEWPTGFDRHAVTAKIDPAKIEKGREVYFREQQCATCHQPHGMGMDPAYPPLGESAWVTGDPERLVKIALHGLQGGILVNGKHYSSEMAPLGALLSDEDAAAVLTYVRASFGNVAPEINAELVARIREENKDRRTLWTARELMELHPSGDDPSMMIPAESPATGGEGRQFVKAWTLEDFAADFDSGAPVGSAERGKAIYEAAGCNDCHSGDAAGHRIGPDLLKVVEKYRGKLLLQQILEPSSEINPDYVSEIIETLDEEMFTGLVLNEDSDSVSILANPSNPSETLAIPKRDIVSRRPASLSSMPTGLLIAFEKQEILDLLAYLEAGVESTATSVPLGGTHWRLVQLGNTPVDRGTVGKEAHLVFDPSSGRVSGSGGCNRLAGTFEAADDSMTFGPLAGTRMACPEGMEIEQALGQALAETRTWRIDGEYLELRDVEGEVLARFEAGSAG